MVMGGEVDDCSACSATAFQCGAVVSGVAEVWVGAAGEQVLDAVSPAVLGGDAGVRLPSR